MIQSIQKIIKIGSSAGVTIPAKELKRQNIKFGDEVEVIIRPIKGSSSKAEDKVFIDGVNDILKDYKSDFENLAKR